MGDDADKRSGAGRVAFLDYLRIFAFLSVLAGHKFYHLAASYVDDEASHATPRLLVKLLIPFCHGGGAGVVVFFLVSGYIIAHILQTERAGEFAVKRVFRIYPLYVVAVLMQYVLGLHAAGAPDVPALLAQLTLFGDFFGAPYALNGVEWTLRVEVLFYVFMGLLRWGGLMHDRRKALPFILVATTVLLGHVGPLPAQTNLARGYLTIYGPFLLLGVFCYLAQRQQVTMPLLAAFAALVFYQYFKLIAAYQPKWLGAHFAALGVMVFAAAWALRGRMTAPPLILLLSDLTYPVYLFHNWAYDAIRANLPKRKFVTANADALALAGLFLVCFLAMRLIEKPGVQLGRRALHKIRSRNAGLKT